MSVSPLLADPLGAAVALGTSADGLEERILDASLELVARWGVTKTAVADVAKTAGCGRATLYRTFPGGKQELFMALARREVAAYLAAVDAAVDAADALAPALTAAVVVASRQLNEHAAFQFLLAHEPGLLLPYLGFGEVDRLYALASTAIGPHLERFLPAERASWAAEWLARLVITFVFSPTVGANLADEGEAAHLVTRYLAPAFSSTAPTT